MRWGVKSTIKTEVQFEFARLVPYESLPRTMWTLEVTAHAKEPGKVAHAQTDYGQPENLCKLQ